MKRKYYYLELKEGEKVVKRQETTFARHISDWNILESKFQKDGQKIEFVVSPEKERIINLNQNQ